MNSPHPLPPSISIVVPTLGDPAHCTIPASFAASGMADQLNVQFVFLLNGITPRPESMQTELAGQPAIIVGNDRFFSTAESNLFRVQDIGRQLMEYVLVVGDHDHIDWHNLALALAYAREHQVEMLGLNVLSRQKQAQGAGDTELEAMPPLADPGLAADMVRNMFAGATWPGNVGYAAMLSSYGPLNWAAYIGAHLYSHQTFVRVLQHRFVEEMYSFVYMQLQFMCESGANYGVFQLPVVHRVDESYLRERNSPLGEGLVKMSESRRIHGNSVLFWVANLSHMDMLRDDDCFAMLANARNISHSFDDNGDISYRPISQLTLLLTWAKQAIDLASVGNSHYFNANDSNYSLVELGYARRLTERLVRVLPGMSSRYADTVDKLIHELDQAALLLRSYLQQPQAGPHMLDMARRHLITAIGLLRASVVLDLNAASFLRYVQKLTGYAVNGLPSGTAA